MRRGAPGHGEKKPDPAGLALAPREGMETNEGGFWSLVRASFRALPGWEKIAVVVVTAFISPVLALAAGMIVLSLFPLILAGGFEGERGTTIGGDVAKAVRRRRQHTERYYST